MFIHYVSYVVSYLIGEVQVRKRFYKERDYPEIRAKTGPGILDFIHYLLTAA